MVGLLLVTHGAVGEALIAAAAHVLGHAHASLRALPVQASDTPESIDVKARTLIAEIDDGAHQQLLFAFERDLIGALRRGQRGHHDADDGDDDDDAKRDEHAQARADELGDA